MAGDWGRDWTSATFVPAPFHPLRVFHGDLAHPLVETGRVLVGTEDDARNDDHVRTHRLHDPAVGFERRLRISRELAQKNKRQRSRYCHNKPALPMIFSTWAEAAFASAFESSPGEPARA